MENRKKLAITNLCRAYLHLNGFLSDSENDKMFNKIRKWQDKRCFFTLPYICNEGGAVMIQDIKRFDNWFSVSYYTVRRKLGQYTKVNEDAFHDAYLLIRINLLFEKKEVLDFEPYFMGYYKRISQREIKHESKYYHLNDVFFEFLSDSEPVSTDDLLAMDKLVHDILDFVKKKFPKSDYKLFKLRNFETQLSYKDLSDYTGISQSQICKKVNHISNVVRQEASFVQRNSQLSS